MSLNIQHLVFVLYLIEKNVKGFANQCYMFLFTLYTMSQFH